MSTHTSRTTTGVPWWKTAVIYQIYIRSFCDSNGDGVGDLPGLISKLDYLADLGVEGLWLSPVTVSANADWGYDVVNYYDIDPELGTLEDFDRLVREARSRGIRIILDLVPNHTSTKHPWFQNALTGRDAKYRDYYIWADGKTGHRPPSNWRSFFAGSAWKYHRPTKQYYLHSFLPQQADLNWRNPAVQEEFDRILEFWLDRGAAGFRIDVFNAIIKDSQLRDNPLSFKGKTYEMKLYGQLPEHTVSQSGVHPVLQRWHRQAVKRLPDVVLLGEPMLVSSYRELASYYGEGHELSMVFNFGFLQEKFAARALRSRIAGTYRWLNHKEWPVITGSNHDQSRLATRWAGGDERKIRLALMMLLMLRGTTVLYYGDEIGLADGTVPPWRLKDPLGKRYWPAFSGRDRERTPMPWSNAPGAGFTSDAAKPWLPIGSRRRNVAGQRADETSIWHLANSLISLRKRTTDLQLGEYHVLTSRGDIWVWRRGKRHIIALNFSDQAVRIPDTPGTVLIDTALSRAGQEVTDLTLQPWEGVVIRSS